MNGASFGSIWKVPGILIYLQLPLRMNTNIYIFQVLHAWSIQELYTLDLSIPWVFIGLLGRQFVVFKRTKSEAAFSFICLLYKLKNLYYPSILNTLVLAAAVSISLVQSVCYVPALNWISKHCSACFHIRILGLKYPNYLGASLR